MVNELVLGKQNIELDNRPTDVLPPADRGDKTLDEDRLSARIIELFQEDIRHKEYYSWGSKREYDLKAYYQQKEDAWAHWPWEGASSYRGALTPTLLDTAWATLNESIWPQEGNPLQVKGYGVEDIRTARILGKYLNNVIENETNLRDTEEKNIFRMLLNGTGTIKIRRTADGNSVDTSAVDVENIYIPLDAQGFRLDQTDHVFQVIPLSYTEIETRKALNVYKNLDSIHPGIGISNETTREKLSTRLDAVTGTDLTKYRRRNMYYILECYMTYFEKDSMKPQELIVWIAPNGGRILRVRNNEDMIRPFSRHVIYDVPGRFFGMSLPEKVRPIQEKLDYSDKQYTDALDRANMPAMFVDDTSVFNPGTAQRVPGGIYQKAIGSKIDFEPVYPVQRGFDQERFNLWSEGERLTGLVDVMQGGSTKSGRTLGETQIRAQSAGVRFNALFSRYEKGWNETMKIMYEYQSRYVSREKKVRLIGYEDMQTVDEIFPSKEGSAYGIGISGNFDFCFSGRPTIERDAEKAEFDFLYEKTIMNPIVASSESNSWKALEELYKVYGKELNFLEKPKSATLLSAKEFIERIVSGQYSVQLRPGIDAEDYIFEIQLFMMSETFKSIDPRAQQALTEAAKKAYVIRTMETQAEMDVMEFKNQIDARTQMKKMMPQNPMQGGQNGIQ